MYIEKIVLSQFRSYTREETPFFPGLNCIQGNNAAGKSNLLEAIYLLSTGKSFRTSRLLDLIKQGEPGFQIETHFVKEGISHSLKINYGSSSGRKTFHNQTAYSSFLPLLGILPCVLLAPEDISILTGAPSERRRFLDIHISQIDPLYMHHLGRYHKAMKQRNSLLKQQQEKGLGPWEELMSISAHYLIEKRIETLAVLEKTLQETIYSLSEKQESFSWKYENSLESTSPSFFLQAWQKSRKKELLMGSTLLGPHRDDISLFIQNKEIKTYCSEGQKRSCIAALRIAEWMRFKDFFGYPPLLGIDDFGIHLDGKRTLLLKESMKNLGQVFLTAPSFSQGSSVFTEGNLFEINQGSILRKNLSNV